MKKVYSLLFALVAGVFCFFGISNVDASCSNTYSGEPKIEFDFGSSELGGLPTFYEKGTIKKVNLCVYGMPVDTASNVSFALNDTSLAKITNLGKQGQVSLNGSLVYYTVGVNVEFLDSGKPRLTANLDYNSNNYQDSIVFTVLDSFYTFGIDKTSLPSSIKAGQNIQLDSIFTDHTGWDDYSINVNSETTWTSSDDSILRVDGGLVTALRGGSATITAKYSKYDRNFADTYYLNVTDDNLYQIIPTAESTGKVEANGSGLVNFGTTVKLKITPQKFYKLKSVSIKNASTNKDVTKEVKYNSATNEFVMPSYNVIVYGNFVPNYTENLSYLKANLSSYSAIKLSWGNAKNAKGYYICYKKASDRNYKCVYSLKGVKFAEGSRYDFKVSPYVIDYGSSKDYMISPNSKSVSIYTLKKLSAPKVKKSSKKKVKVTFVKINGASGYEVAYSKKKSKSYKIKNVSSSKNSIILKVKKGKKMYYKVRAYKIENGKKIYAPWSSIKSYKLK